jgi:hypothetical protein
VRTELSFKKGPDGFFNCTICRAYTKPHPILFKIHLVRCAAEFEDYPTDTSDSEAESDTSYVSAAKPNGKGKAVEMSDSDDAGSGSNLGSDDGSKREQAKKDKTAERAARKEKLAAKNATRKEKREAKKQRRDLKDKDGPKEKKPKIRKENRKIPSLARPSGGPSSSSGAGPARVKKQRPADSDDEVEHIDVKPLGGTKRQQPFARSAAVTLDQEHLVVDSDDSQSDEDDDTIVVLVRGSGTSCRVAPAMRRAWLTALRAPFVSLRPQLSTSSRCPTAATRVRHATTTNARTQATSRSMSCAASAPLSFLAPIRRPPIRL